jgi:hypothetical protein
MGILASVKSSYGELLLQSSSLLEKVTNSSNDQRPAFENMVDLLDLAIMKLARLIKNNPSIHADCRAQIDLDSLQTRVDNINKLVYGSPLETPLHKVALSAFAYGAIGGAIISQLRGGPLGAGPQQSEVNFEPSEPADKDSLEVAGFLPPYAGIALGNPGNPLLAAPFMKGAGIYSLQVMGIWTEVKDIIVDIIKYLLDHPDVAKKILEIIVEMFSKGKDKATIVAAVIQLVNVERGK